MSVLGAAQSWLQGWPDVRRPWLAVKLGNGISSLRYWSWRWFTKEGRDAY